MFSSGPHPHSRVGRSGVKAYCNIVKTFPGAHRLREWTGKQEWPQGQEGQLMGALEDRKWSG